MATEDEKKEFLENAKKIVKPKTLADFIVQLVTAHKLLCKKTNTLGDLRNDASETKGIMDEKSGVKEFLIDPKLEKLNSLVIDIKDSVFKTGYRFKNTTEYFILLIYVYKAGVDNHKNDEEIKNDLISCIPITHLQKAGTDECYIEAPLTGNPKIYFRGDSRINYGEIFKLLKSKINMIETPSETPTKQSAATETEAKPAATKDTKEEKAKDDPKDKEKKTEEEKKAASNPPNPKPEAKKDESKADDVKKDEEKSADALYNDIVGRIDGKKDYSAEKIAERFGFISKFLKKAGDNISVDQIAMVNDKINVLREKFNKKFGDEKIFEETNKDGEKDIFEKSRDGEIKLTETGKKLVDFSDEDIAALEKSIKDYKEIVEKFEPLVKKKLDSIKI